MKIAEDRITNAGTEQFSVLLETGRPFELAANACKEPWEGSDKTR